MTLTETRPVFVTDWRVARELTRTLPADTSMSAHLLYVMIAGHLNRDGVCWPSTEALAAETGMHLRTVRKARAELEQRGLLVTIVGGGNRPNAYRLVDYRLSPPRAVRPGSPRAVRPRPRAESALTPGPRPGEEEEEVCEEVRACACGAALTAGRWRCSSCQDQVEPGAGPAAVMLDGWRNRPVL